MSKGKVCHLCMEICEDYKSLYDESGNANDAHQLLIEYFDIKLLNGVGDIRISVMCLKCWHQISDFKRFQQSVYVAQKIIRIKKEEIDIKSDEEFLPEDIHEQSNDFKKEDSLSLCDSESMYLSSADDGSVADDNEENDDSIDLITGEELVDSAALNADRNELLTTADKLTESIPRQATKSISIVVRDHDAYLIQKKIESKEYKLQLKRGRSKVWDTFSNIITEKGEVLSSYVSCKKCYKVVKYSSNTTSNLVKHKCYRTMNAINQSAMVNVDAETQCKTSILCTQWTLENCRPFDIVQDNGFTEIIEEIIKTGALFGPNVNLNSLLPHPSTISKNIDELYKIHFGTIKNEFSEIKKGGFALTTDLWPDSYLRKSFIALTIHYISNGKMCSKLLSMLSVEGEQATHANILQQVTNSLQLYGCGLDDVSTMVTSGEFNMTAVVKPHDHVFCIAHLLRSVLEKSMAAVNEVLQLYRCCTNLVKYFKTTGLNSTFKTSLENYAPTRWNRVYSVFRFIGENLADVENALRERNELSRVTGIQLNHINEIIAILQPFLEAFDKLDREKYPTIHLVYVYAHHLKKKCNTDPLDSEFTTQFKNKILENIDAILFKNLQPIHKLAIFLFPPTKKMLQFDDTEKENVRCECKRIMESFVDLLPVHSEQRRVTLNSDEPMFDFLDHIKADSSVDQISAEMNTYENMTISHSKDFNILQWWEVHKKQFPLLYYTSCKVLCTPATSTASDRIFSQSRNLISDKCGIIPSNHELINKIMFLHCNIDKKNLQIEKLSKHLT